MTRAVFFDLDDTLIRFPSGHARMLLLWQAARHLGTLFSERRPAFAAPFAFRVLAEARGHLLRERAHVRHGDHQGVRTTIHEHWTWCLQEALERLGRVEASEEDLALVSRAFFEGPFAQIALRTIRPFEPMIALARALRADGLTVILATNPFVPWLGVEQRLTRAGLSSEDFDALTCAENSRFLKPSAYYYADLLERYGLRARDVRMVGNDPVRDGAARQVGIQTLIVTPRRNDAEAAAQARVFVGA